MRQTAVSSLRCDLIRDFCAESEKYVICIKEYDLDVLGKC